MRDAVAIPRQDVKVGKRICQCEFNLMVEDGGCVADGSSGKCNRACNGKAANVELTIPDRESFFVNFQVLREAKEVRALVIEEEGSEILIDLDSLIKWSIVPPNFPFPQLD